MTNPKLSEMTLRDSIAIAAMQGWLSSYGPKSTHPAINEAEGVARESYAMADAMLVERAKLGQAEQPAPAATEPRYYAQNYNENRWRIVDRNNPGKCLDFAADEYGCGAALVKLNANARPWSHWIESPIN
jgi:hypothetical protein